MDVDFVTYIFRISCKAGLVSSSAATSLPDDNSKREPPDPISNSEVKLLSADGSVGVPM